MTIFRYCNSRVSVYDGTGRHLHDIEGDWTVVHSLALYEQVDNVIVIVVVTVIVIVNNFVHCLDLCTNDFYHTPLQEDLLCLADREGKQVECVGAGLR